MTTCGNCEREINGETYDATQEIAQERLDAAKEAAQAVFDAILGANDVDVIQRMTDALRRLTK